MSCKLIKFIFTQRIHESSSISNSSIKNCVVIFKHKQHDEINYDKSTLQIKAKQIINEIRSQLNWSRDESKDRGQQIGKLWNSS